MRTAFLKSIVFASLSLFMVAVSLGAQEAQVSGKAKYVFLLIGDGMGSAQRETAAKYLARTGGAPLAMNSLPHVEATTTSSLSGTTDSAAAGTALACGVKTKNGRLGLDGDGKRVESVAERVKRLKPAMKVGILTSTPVNHATPAAFYAHVKSRGEYSKISEFIPASDFELLAGSEFLVSKGCSQPDAAIEKEGYKIVRSFADFSKAEGGKLIFICPRPLAIDAASGDASSFDSAMLLSKAIERLDNPNGFFIMLEGGRVDWACHDNDLAAAVKETLDFDGAVRVALDFYKKHPADTLLVVTADHETGGLSFTDSSGCDIGAAVGGQLHSKSALQGYLGKCRKARTPYPELRERMMAEFGFKTLSEKDEKALQDAYAAFLDAAATDTRAAEIKKMYGGKNPVLLVCSRIVDAKAGVKWGAFDHSDSKVVTSAIGVGSESFAGEGDNTMIPRKIEKAMGL